MSVYLSSTLEDLRPYRAVALEALRKHDHLVKDSYLASPKPTVAQCLSDVRACDIYVGIFAGRYGWCPEGHGGKSITELEYWAAVNAGKPIFAFIRPIEICIGSELDDTKKDYESVRKRDELRQAVQSGEGHTCALFTDVADLALKITQALPKGKDGVAAVESAPPIIDRAPDTGTELQQMLAHHLNQSWSRLGRLAEFRKARVFDDLQGSFTAKAVFDVTVRSEPAAFLLDLGWMVSEEGEGGSLPLLRKNGDFCEAIKLMTLVAGEAFVLNGTHGIQIKGNEPLDGKDPRVVAVLAAACKGFGLRLIPGIWEPENFLQLSAEEFGHEQGKDLVRKELVAKVKHQLHLKAHRLKYRRDPKSSGASDMLDSVVKALLDDLKKVLKCRLVIVAPAGSPMCDAKLASSIHADFAVPTLYKGIPRPLVRQLIDNLAVLISPLLDGTLSVQDEDAGDER